MLVKELFNSLAFQYPFRKYQQIILDQIAQKPKDRKYHIVAPPGSGKTIVGIELIRRSSEKAVVFAPTSTIQLQWKEKVQMFIPKDSTINLDELVSLDPTQLKLINCFTYQLLSSPADNLQFIEDSANNLWKESLIKNNIAIDETEAANRITTIRTNNIEEYNHEITKYYKKIKDQLLRDPNFDGTQFLHKNALQLINDLVKSDIKIIVLDEVHHLLDYWALVLKELIKQIEDVYVIGLTATPPLSANEEELTNYLSIVDAIDFEIPTPAVVKEGNLAPYQDLVYFCKPTNSEKEFINSIQNRFQRLITDLGNRDDFKQWISNRVIKRTTNDGKTEDWTEFFNQHLNLAIAGIKYCKQILKERIPQDINLIEEMDQELSLDDWVYLLVDYSLNYLKLSVQVSDHDILQNIKGVLKSFGFVLTETGLRQQRSPTDKILALSESKNEAVTQILSTEMIGLGDVLRAIVITDYEKENATTAKYFEDVLDSDAGSAVDIFKSIVQNPKTTQLETILVTGTVVLIDKDKSDTIISAMRDWQKVNNYFFSINIEPTVYPGILKIIGSGSDWQSNTYVRMVTDLFEKGITKCLVGTKGLLGEGWDSLKLNTLIDLSAATTSTTVNQIRGRSIRLDPTWPQKVANNWDVVCIDTNFEKGDHDFIRFLKKHDKFWGLGSKGKIVKGILHVDEFLALQYITVGFKRILFNLVTQRMLAKALDRKQIYTDWAIGEKYSNFEYSATKLDGADLKFKTVFTLKESLMGIFNTILTSLGIFAFWYFYLFSDLLEYSFENQPIFLGLSVILIGGLILVSIKNITKYVKKGFLEVPIDSFLLDIGKALLKGLRESTLINQNQSVDNVRVIQDPLGQYDLYLDYATPEDAKLFADSLKELLAPVIDQRYLVSRSIDDINLGFYRPIWWTIRKLFRLLKQEKVAYHPVPSNLAINQKRTYVFAKAWKEYVGGGELIYTRTTKGREILLKIREYNYHKIKRMTFDIWR